METHQRKQWSAGFSRRVFESEWNGPGGLPAWKIRFSGRDRVDLLEWPWQGADPFTLGAWVSGDGKLELRCLDAAGRNPQSLELIAWGSLMRAQTGRHTIAQGNAP